MRDFKYIYGPVFSWRLGSSLGIDPLGGKIKICSFDCIYCQLGKTDFLTKEREEFVPTDKTIKEIKSLPRLCMQGRGLPSLKIDYITFSGMGEPTLAKNLGKIVKEIRKIREEKIAILTNASLIDREDVREDLSLFDLVVTKLDAHSQDSFKRINRPLKNIKFERILEGIKKFKDKTRLALQIMFLKENKDEAKELAKIAKEISPFCVQINTPLRPCKVKPLSKDEIYRIKEYFSAEGGPTSGGKGLNIICVYDIKKRKIIPLSKEETLRRRREL